jgi:hypothetical protein
MATRANVLAQVQLTLRLLDRVRTSHGRVVTLAGPIRWLPGIVPAKSNADGAHGYRAYLLSQTRLLVFSLELSRRLGDEASAVVVNPGPVKTDPSHGVPLTTRVANLLRAQSPSLASQTAIAAATSETGKNGELLGTNGEVPIPGKLVDPELGRQLWDWCAKALREEELAPPPPPVKAS